MKKYISDFPNIYLTIKEWIRVISFLILTSRKRKKILDEFEKELANYIGVKYSVFLSSG